jgi:hypothetical protein
MSFRSTFVLSNTSLFSSLFSCSWSSICSWNVAIITSDLSFETQNFLGTFWLLFLFTDFLILRSSFDISRRCSVQWSTPRITHVRPGRSLKCLALLWWCPCVHVVFSLFGSWKYELVIVSLFSAKKYGRRCLLLFALLVLWGPRTDGQVVESRPRRALKSPTMMHLSPSGIARMIVATDSQKA